MSYKQTWQHQHHKLFVGKINNINIKKANSLEIQKKEGIKILEKVDKKDQIFILDEKVGIRRWIAIFFGFIGVLIIFRPGTSLFSYFSLLPLLGAVALSFAVIIMKKLVSYDSPPTCSFYLHVFIALIYFPFVIFNWQQPSLNLWLMLIGMGFCGGIAQILLTNAYRLSTVNLLQPFDYTAIIWAITFGVIFFNDYPDRYVIIGSIVIVISTYYIIYREAKLGKKINAMKINRRQI